MNISIIKFSLISTILFMYGCANLNSIHRSTIGSNPEMHFIDAKQRVVWSVPNGQNRPARVCAEPSPDVMSAISSSMGLSVSKEEIEAAFNAVMAEGASTIGIRTASIQLLRDAMYRACEAYTGGAMTPDDYSILTKRYQKSMVTLLAIEQLTTTVYPPTVTLNSMANNDYNRQIFQATQLQIDAKNEIEKLTDEKAKSEKEKKAIVEEVKKANKEKIAADNEVTNGNIDCKNTTINTEKEKCKTQEKASSTLKKKKEKQTKLETKIADLDKKLVRKNEDLEKWNNVLTHMKEPSRDVAVSSSVHANTRTINSEDIVNVAGVIRTMVKDVHNAELIEGCFDLSIVDKLAKMESSLEILELVKNQKKADKIKLEKGEEKANENVTISNRADAFVASIASSETQDLNSIRTEYENAMKLSLEEAKNKFDRESSIVQMLAQRYIMQTRWCENNLLEAIKNYPKETQLHKGDECTKEHTHCISH